MKGVTLNAASARCAFYGSREVVFRGRTGAFLAVPWGPPGFFIVERGHSVLSDASVQLNRPRFLILLAAVSTGALAVLLVPEWHVPATADSRYWNALVAFALLGIVCDSSFLPIERVPFAKLSSSVAFI